MAETKETTSKTETKNEKAKAGDGSVTFEDHGDSWIEVDNRGEHEIRTRLPKSLRDIPVPERRQKEIAERMKAEDDRKQAELEQEGLASEPPPVEDPDKDYEKDPEIVVTHKGESKSEAKT